MIKLSGLKDDEIVIDENLNVYEVSDAKYYIKNNIDQFEKLYITTEERASFDAESILDSAIDDVYQDLMYEDWDESIKMDITKDDIKKIQAVLDDIIERGGDQNIAYFKSKEIEIDI